VGKISKALSKLGVEKGPSVIKADRAELKKTSFSPLKPKLKREEEQINSRPQPVIIESEAKKTWDERLRIAIEEHPAIAESFRRLRAKILHPVDKESIQSILVTSADLGEGKSFVAANLGVILAQSMERHAMVVDCDLRRPSLAGLFGLDNRQGLVNHLREGTDLSLLIRKTGLDGLSIIPAGPVPGNPSELLGSDKMAVMVNEIVNRYHDRMVILDSPPAQAASETAVLAQHVDKVVVVVRWGGPGREQVKKLVESIGKDKILGVVFNAFEMTLLDAKLQGEGYYKYYSEGY
jgi:protein-tyrosine kinase